jgi:hypothetical protein
MVVALISAGHLQMILDLKRRIGCSVTSAASSWRVAQIEKAAGFSPRLAIFRQIAAGLAHQPNGRRRNALTRKRHHEPPLPCIATLISHAFTPFTSKRLDFL